MSRLPTGGETLQRKPTNNVYTTLAVIGTVAVILALLVIYTQAKTLFGDPGLFGGS